MASPKAILCTLESGTGAKEEEALRSVGFATAVVPWSEIASQINGWTQLLPLLEDPNLAAIVFVGRKEAFTTEVKSRVAALSCALEREKWPTMAFVVTDAVAFDSLPDALSHVKIYSHTQPFASKLMVLKVRPVAKPVFPFYCKAHLDPLLGQWLEIGPHPGDAWSGFMIGVTAAEITAFGVGPKGLVPQKSSLEYPILGIQGDFRNEPFSACAARNVLTQETSCFMRIDGALSGIFCTAYPGEEGDTAENSPVLSASFG